jgi:hypothetical protein
VVSGVVPDFAPQKRIKVAFDCEVVLILEVHFGVCHGVIWWFDARYNSMI